VLGISPWESPFSLYWRKVNGWDADLSDEMEWGTRLEDAIALKYVTVHPDRFQARASLMVGAQPWMLATPDRLLYDDPWSGAPAIGLLETKCAHSGDGWGEPGTSQIPVNYRAQVLWQMAVTGLYWADVAVLVAGSDYREYTVLRDERDIAVMVEAGRRFMARLEAGEPPPIDDHHATLATVKRLHPDLDDTEVEVSQRLATGYRRACEMARKAKAVKARYEALLRAEMGRARKATHDGEFVASRSIYTVAAHPVREQRVDRLNPPRGRKP
jgi:putative phage-type endonuclease